MTTATVLEAPSVPLGARTNQKALLEGLSYVTKAIAARLPVLTGVLVEGADDGLRLTCTNLELILTQSIPGSGSGRALLPGHLLLKIVKKLEKGQGVELTDAGSHVLVVAGELKYRVPKLPIDDYPGLPAGGAELGSPAFHLSGDQLLDLGRVLHAASHDEGYPVLTGMRLEVNDETVIGVCTDRFRLAACELPRQMGNSQTGCLLVPADAMTIAVAAFSKAPLIRFGMRSANSSGLFTVYTDDRTLTVRLLDGEFPNYRGLLLNEADVTTRVVVNAAQMLKAIDQVKVVLTFRNAPVRLGVEQGQVLISASSGADEAGAERTIPGGVFGCDVTTAFNPRFYEELVTAVGAARVTGWLPGGQRPSMWFDADRPHVRMLLMPVRMPGSR